MDVMILASLLGAGLLILDLWTAPRAEGKSPSKRSAWVARATKHWRVRRHVS